MNIPAIYYVSNALSIIKDGDLVEIDGARGVVNFIKEPTLEFVPTTLDAGMPH